MAYNTLPTQPVSSLYRTTGVKTLNEMVDYTIRKAGRPLLPSELIKAFGKCVSGVLPKEKDGEESEHGASDLHTQ